MDQSQDQVLTKSFIAEIKLNQLIDETKARYNLKSSDISLSGFSQGCMLSLQTGIKLKR